MEKYSTQELQGWDREFLWHPFTPMKPWSEGKEIVVIERGEEEFLIDTLGRRYIDGVSSLWCNVHGHCVPELDEAVREQLGRIAHSTLLGLSNVPAIELGKKLVELLRGCGIGLDKVFYSDDGSTAVEVACKMAYQYWENVGENRKLKIENRKRGERARFIAFQNAYHGDTIGAVSVGGIELFHGAFRGLTFEADFVKAGDWRAAEELLKADAEKYAGIIVEPLVLGAGGMVMYGGEVLRELRRIADAHGTLLIFDEVMTGFGRTGKMFAAEHGGGVTPDLMCLSKGLTAGYMPLGVTMTTRKVFEAFYAEPAEGKTFFHGHTFTGHPLACAVAVKSLELFERNRLLEHVEKMAGILSEMLERVRGKKFVGDVRQLGLIGAIDLVDAEGRAFDWQRRVGGALCLRMRELGLMMRPLGDTVVIMPPLAIREENMRRLCAGVLRSLEWMPEIAGSVAMVQR